MISTNEQLAFRRHVIAWAKMLCSENERCEKVITTKHGPLALSIPVFLDGYSSETFCVFRRFLDPSTAPAEANPHNGKWNFHYLGTPDSAIAAFDFDMSSVEAVPD